MHRVRGILTRAPRPSPRLLRVLVPTGVAALLIGFDGSVSILALPAIATDFRAPTATLTELGSVLSLGSLIGLPLAMQADRLGRRRLLLVGVAGASGAGLASAAATGLTWLGLARLAAVAFETAAASAAAALVVEEVPAGQRGRAVSILTLAGGAGVGLATLLYPLLAPNWRPLYAAAGAGLVAVPLLARHLPESRAWAGAGRSPAPLSLLARPPWRRRLLLLAASTGLSSFLFQPAGLLVALFGSRDLGLSPALISTVVVVSGLASVPAFSAGGALSDRFGRRLPSVTFGAGAALGAGATFLGGPPAYWAGNVLWSLFASAGAPVLATWLGELFPTRARATAETVGSVAGALGGTCGFQLVRLLQPALGLGPALATAGLAALAGTALLLLLPETRGEPLRD
ncbi:MAG TPA: MFS transporter [Candidatus Dormibacteraeota bacterium]|nr:MFS transporter [Candidatus Dormibacteraeota bacterium]